MNTVASRGWILPGLSLLPVFRRGHSYLATDVFPSPQVVPLYLNVLTADEACVTMNTVASRGWILPGLSLLPVFR